MSLHSDDNSDILHRARFEPAIPVMESLKTERVLNHPVNGSERSNLKRLFNTLKHSGNYLFTLYNKNQALEIFLSPKPEVM
jgi:hypothetical protein